MVEMEFFRGEKKYYYETDIRDDEIAGHPMRMTCYHSVISNNWDTEHVLMIQDAERIIGREICGFKLDDGKPCTRVPLRIDEEPYPDEIGRCIIHRPSQKKKEIPPTDISSTENTIVTSTKSTKSKPPIAMTKVTKKILSIADEQFMNCSVCIKRSECKQFGENDNKCIIEKTIFNEMLSDIVNEFSLNNIVDQLHAYTIVDTMLKIIRTGEFESNQGILQSISTGNAGYGMTLKKLLYQGLSKLAVDRKTRIIYQQRDGNTSAYKGSLAEALSQIDINSVEVSTAKIQVKKTEENDDDDEFREVPLGLGGKVIMDDIRFDDSPDSD